MWNWPWCGLAGTLAGSPRWWQSSDERPFDPQDVELAGSGLRAAAIHMCPRRSESRGCAFALDTMRATEHR